MKKLAFFEITGWEKNYVKKALKNYDVKFFEETLDEIDLKKIKDCEIISVFIYSKITKKSLELLPKLKVIATRSTGFDHIDVKACKSKKIKVCNVPFYGENTVAEHTVALILSLSRNIHKSYLRTLKDDYSIEGLTGFDLKGKTIGIIGGGHIGMHVARIARGFAMNVLVYDLKKDNFMAEIIGYKYAEFDDLLKQSDIVSLHVPYNKYTHHILNKDKLKLMKKTAILINTARGGLIDTDDLYEVLNKKQLGGAGLDVLEGEELIMEEKQLLHDKMKSEKWRELMRNQTICKMDNVVFTPHNAFNSREALQRILDTTMENIEMCIDNKCRFVINE